MKSYKAVFLCIISASLLALSFPLTGMWGLAWVALVPLFAAIKGKGFLDSFLLGFLAGIVFFYSTISWLNFIAVMATAALVLYLALYFALFAGIAAAIIGRGGFETRPYMPVFVKAVLVSSAWVVLEFIRSNLFAGFGWNLLGYSQAGFLPAIQIADITGVWGVSFIVMFVNVVVYEFAAAPSLRAPNEVRGEAISARRLPACRQGRLRRPEVSGLLAMTQLVHNKLVNLFFCLLLIAAVFIYGFLKLGYQLPVTCYQLLKISIIQGNIPQTLKWDESYRQNIIDTYFNLTKQAAKDMPELIIWPETSFPVDFESEPELANRLYSLAKEVNAYLLVGANRFSGSKIYNSAFLISPEGRIKGRYDKLHLVPFGEYMPKIPRFMYRVLPEKINMVGDFTPGEECTVFKLANPVIASEAKQSPGTEIACLPARQASSPSAPRNDGDVCFSVLICFEDVFPALSRRFVKNGAKLLVNITNDGWYGVSAAPFQHAQASVFRAVENRVPVVRSANTGYSVFIDEKGRVINRMEPFTAGYKTEVCKIKS